MANCGQCPSGHDYASRPHWGKFGNDATFTLPLNGLALCSLHCQMGQRECIVHLIKIDQITK